MVVGTWLRQERSLALPMFLRGPPPQGTFFLRAYSNFLFQPWANPESVAKAEVT